MTLNPSSIVLLLGSALLMIAAALVFAKRKTPGAWHFFVLLFFGAIYACTNAIEVLLVDPTQKSLLPQWEMVGGLGGTIAFLFFSLDFQKPGRKFSLFFTIPLITFSILSLILCFTNSYHHLIWVSWQLNNTVTIPYMIYEHGWVYFVLMGTLFLLTFISLLIMMWTYFQTSRDFQGQIRLLLLALSIPFVAYLIYFSGANPWPSYEIPTIGFTIATLIVTFVFFRTSYFRISPRAKEKWLELMPDGLLVLDFHGKIIECNRAFREAFLIEEKPEGLHLSQFLAPQNLINFIGSGVNHKDGHTPVLAPSGRSFDLRRIPLADRTGQDAGELFVLADVTERRKSELELAHSEARFRGLFENSSDALVLLEEGVYIDCNPQTLRVFGLTREQFIHTSILDHSPLVQPGGKNSLELSEEYMRRAQQEGPQKFEWNLKRENGEEFPADIQLSPVEFHGRQILQATIRDISGQKRTQQELEHLASRDPLTGVFNRRTGLIILEKKMSHALRTKSPLTLAFIDINGLKKINDQQGHKAGDDLIQAVAALLNKNIRDSDTLCRMGGDEFLIIFIDCDSPAASAVLERTQRRAQAHFEKGEVPFHISFSTGLITYPREGQDLSVAALVEEADLRMYESKRAFHQRKIDHP